MTQYNQQAGTLEKQCNRNLIPRIFTKAARISCTPSKVESTKSFDPSAFPTSTTSVFSRFTFNLFTSSQFTTALWQWFRTSMYHKRIWIYSPENHPRIDDSLPQSYKWFVPRALHRDSKARGIELCSLQLNIVSPTLMITGFNSNLLQLWGEIVDCLQDKRMSSPPLWPLLHPKLP